ncbi:hypothetical protein BIV60_24655 [Bacillus sp. MUM 116]|uniref:hypothetical protein n=1 Tax=Bacillus sp. MUM 116 TaxID=1678002 RepID=UPI0008F5C550|nr:hypothetical protein [Bacillus sp. MUM 116]OIK09228.1 hypothetical protein BIV60_24655 [Bacillus sp. MUM 116]
MIEVKETVDKVVDFVQSVTNTKNFRPDYPVSDELRHELMEIFRDFMNYALKRYFHVFAPILEEFVEEHETREEKKDILLHNLFWWRILYDSCQNFSESCMADYLAENYIRFSKCPAIISWLKVSWKVFPKFYYVGYKYNDRFFVVVDILTEKTFDVLVCDPLAIPPEKGEIMMGTLITLGDGLHSPIVDFYHFDYEATKEIAIHIPFYFEKHSKSSTMQEAFLHILSAMLQIEKLIFQENHDKNTSK